MYVLYLAAVAVARPLMVMLTTHEAVEPLMVEGAWMLGYLIPLLPRVALMGHTDFP